MKILIHPLEFLFRVIKYGVVIVRYKILVSSFVTSGNKELEEKFKVVMYSIDVKVSVIEVGRTWSRGIVHHIASVYLYLLFPFFSLRVAMNL